jgi:hypothetical protein
MKESLMPLSTPKKRQSNYLAKYGAICPFCESGDIENCGTDHCGTEIYNNVACNTCGKNWRDIFTLTGIDEN